MFHRFSTWWRALSVVLLGLATLAWPSAAQAQATPAFSVLDQGAVATLSTHGASSFALDLSIPHGTTESVVLSLYTPIVYRSEVSAVIAGSGPSSAAVSSTRISDPTCASGSTLSLVVSLFSEHGTGAPRRCGNAPVHLRLPCQAAACDGVYPLSIAVTIDNVRHVEWSMVAVHASSVLLPLRVDFVPVVDPTSWAAASLAESNFAVIAQYSSLPLTMAIDYRPLSHALLSSSSRPWRTALDNALASPRHHVIAAPPSDVDYAGLAANGFASEVSRQVGLASQFLHTLTGRSTGAGAFIAGTPSSSTLASLAHAGVSDAVIDEASLTVPPSTTLSWGAPFHLTGVSNLTALATDGGLEQLAADASIEPGRRAALTLATLAFLHFEAPNAPAVRTVVIPFNVGSVSPTYLGDLFAASSSNPFFAPGALTPSFDPTLIGADQNPGERTLGTGTISIWSPDNVSTLSSLLDRTNSYLQAVASPVQKVALETYSAVAEQTGGAGDREAALTTAASYLDGQLDEFRIDNSTITLAGSGSELPITLFTSAHYPVTLVLHFITDRLTFPKNQKNYAVFLSTSTNPLRFPVTDAKGGSLTLQLELTTPDGKVILAQTAVQVRDAGTSVVGYLLSGASLFVLAWWWLRTYRRRSRGRHAR